MDCTLDDYLASFASISLLAKEIVLTDVVALAQLVQS
jgi:hypothetical protein